MTITVIHPISSHRIHNPDGGSHAVRSLCRAFTLIELIVVIVIVAALATLVVPNIGRTTDDAEEIIARATMQTLREAIKGSAAGPGYLSDFKRVPEFESVNLRVHDLLSPSTYLEVSAFDPVAARGWRGPYLQNTRGVSNTNPDSNGAFPSSNERRFAGDKTFLERGFFTDAITSPYGKIGDLTVADPWGNPIVIQVPPASAFTGIVNNSGRFRHARLVSAGPNGILETPLLDTALGRLGGMLIDGSKDARGDDLVVFLNREDVYEIE